MSTNALVVAAIAGLVGGFKLFESWTEYGRYQTLTALATDQHGARDGETVQGPVTVTEPADPDRCLPDGREERSTGHDDVVDALEDGAAPAICAWRVRSKRKKNRGSTWRTVDSGVAVGEFGVDDGWETVDVAAESVADSVEEPFDSDTLYLGNPDIDIALGEQTRVQQLADKYLPGDPDVTISPGPGRGTMSPDRYQATVVRDGEELLVHGTRTGDSRTIRADNDTPLVLVDGDPQQQADEHYGEMRRQAALGVVAIAVALGVVALSIL